LLVERLSLAGFRSYATLEVEFPAGPQVIVGPNAAGKTNLLEALVLLGSGRSHRAATDAELIRWGDDFARLEAAARSGDDAAAPTLIELVLATGGGSGRAGGSKRVRINGVPRRAAALADALPTVLFAPEDMLLVIGPPSLRRAALDNLISQTKVGAAAAYATYGRALTQRNNLLRAIRDGSADPAELRYWDEVIIEQGGLISGWRRATLAALAGPLAAAHSEIAPAEGSLALRYVSNAEPVGGESPADAIRRRLAETAEKEAWNGATLVGPHRDDAAFSIDGRDLAGVASRGQQRTAILALKLAELELLRAAAGRPPLLLLDDVFSELDPDRRAHLVRRIGELPQAFVTTTTLDDLDPALVARSTAWSVSPGRLARASRR
jgi:DNA replication and repair protein RecF